MTDPNWQAVDRATRVLEAQNAGVEELGWRITIAPERRGEVTAVVARCICGFVSLPHIGDGAGHRAALAAARHIRIDSHKPLGDPT